MRTRLILIFIVILFLSGCESFRQSNWRSNSYDSPLSPQSAGYGEVSDPLMPSGNQDLAAVLVRSYQSEPEKSVPKDEEKIVERIMIYDAYIRLDPKYEFDSTISHLTNIAKKYNGFVLNYYQSRVVLRIPPDKLNIAMEEISTLGNVSQKSMSGNDITNEYHDLKLKLDNLEKTRDRYLEILKKADSVPTILEIEKELERVRNNIELIKGQLKRYAHLIEYSTLTVDLEQKDTVRPGPIGWIFYGLYHGIKWLFVWE
jgi:hypothetical protein